MRMNMIKVPGAWFLSILILAGFAAGGERVRNVILLVPDGLSVTDMTLARWYQEGRPLAMDGSVCGLIRTYCADSLITDSAAAGSAYATGFKVAKDSVSIRPRAATMPGIEPVSPENADRPLPTLLEAARLQGLATGVVCTSAFSDATPAAFTSHASNRYQLQSISEQMVYSGIDVLLGGGRDFLVPGSERNNRKDGEDLIGALREMGYAFVEDRDGLNRCSSEKVWGVFDYGNLPADFDRDAGSQPSLEEMTRKAIDLLSRNPKGFVLVVEGSLIDKFAHDNDPIGIISEALAFDRAFGAALEFARKDGKTAVVACPDHATGGLQIQNAGSAADLAATLRRAVKTSRWIEGEVQRDESNLERILVEGYGLYGLAALTSLEREAARAALTGNLPLTIGRMMAERASIAFSTVDHTGEEVVLFAYHPSGYGPAQFAGSPVVQNTDINHYVRRILGIDPAACDNLLFVPGTAFESKGATVWIDRSDEANPVFTAQKGESVLRLPINKNLAFLNGKRVGLNGLVTEINGRVWVPRDAVALIR